VKKTLTVIIIVALFFAVACKREEPPAKEIKIAADLSPNESTYLDIVLNGRKELTQTKIIIQPTQGMDPKNLLIGNEQPDIFELDYQDRIPMLEKSAELHKMFQGEYEWSMFGLSYFAPGVIENRKFYFMPFRLRWPAFFYNKERVPEPPQDFPALAKLCQDRPGSMGLLAGDDEAVLEFMLSLIWAYNGSEFELEDPNTQRALTYLASIKNCMTPYSENYDAQSLADALAKGEIDFAFAGFNTAFKLWSDGSLPQTIVGVPVPGKFSIPFSGTYLGVSRASKRPKSAYKIAFFLTTPDTCGKIINSGLWLCALPFSNAEPPPGRVDLFAPFLASQGRLKPAPANVDYIQLQKIYREIFTRIVFKNESEILVGADMRIKLKNLEQGL
jgi:ABC-type glycerol-3-phosphate transport system substrate-binding protein